MDRFSLARDIRDRRKKGETIEKSRQARMNDERRYFKFIGKYVEGLYPMIFADAVAFHKETQQKNPGVNDCTKTVEFISRVTPNMPIPRHYYRRQNRPQMQEIVLEIPLLTNEQTLAITTTTSSPVSVPELPPVSAPLPSPLPEPQPVSVPELPPVSAPLPSPLPEPQPVSVPELPPVSAPLPSPLPEPQPVSVPELPPVSVPFPLPLPELPPVSLPELPPEIYIDMLKEIQLDPQLNQIFNDFQEDDVGMDDIVWDDISEHNVQMF